jgi:hypothetical protein
MFAPIDGSNLDFFPDAPKAEILTNAYIDVKRGLCLDENFTPTKSSLRDYIALYDESNRRSWIRSCNRVKCEISSAEAIRREALLREKEAFNYIETLKSKNVINLSKNKFYIKLTSNHFNSFGHIMEDVFTKIRKIPFNELIKYNKPICCLFSTGRDVEFFKSWLKALLPNNIKNIDFKFLLNDKLYYVPYVLDIKQTTQHCNLSCIEEFNWLNERMHNIFYEPSSAKTKIFLTRVAPLRRHILNSNELHEKLKNIGVKIITGKEPLKERYNAFYHASHICGYHGAAMIHNYFSNEDVKILEYISNKKFAKCFAYMYKKTNSYCIKLIDTDEKLNAVIPINEIVDFYNS